MKEPCYLKAETQKRRATILEKAKDMEKLPPLIMLVL